MAGLRETLELDRTARNTAREAFDLRLAQVRRDLDAQGIGGRIADRVGHGVLDSLDEAAEIANENRGIVAGTIAAIAVWLFRNPILAWIDGLLPAQDTDGDRS